ncbi:MAG: DNA recombination protein RmuC [Patescibacteria group bacterium]|nr:DNA recombination protein RmuC [Patescibacteria group bacterium]
MSDFLFILIIFLIVAGGVTISIFLIRRETQALKEKKEESALTMIKQDIEAMRQRVEDGYGRVAQELGRLQEIGHTMRDFQDFLKSPKLRGNIGEQVLRDLLDQVLPKSNFSLQYQFQEGQIVDAIIKTKQGIIPIDSKFSMEGFKRISQAKPEEQEQYQREFIRDIKKHIDDISKKYILPQEGTVDFALMYVPSEPVYYEITLNQPELLEYGYHKKVYFVSPNSFYYFLKIIMIGLEGAKIEEASKKILEGLKAIQQESVKFGEELGILASHIDHAKGASDRVQSRYSRLVGRIDSLRMLEEEKPKEIEKTNE